MMYFLLSHGILITYVRGIDFIRIFDTECNKELQPLKV
jgi:hypothetical protein